MTEAQRAASDPRKHVWVSASAGSGKTKVLTDRVLRLLLSGTTAPHRILCLTYTNAAAAEMRARLQRTLTDWAVQAESDIHKNIAELTGEAPTAAQLGRARRLFAQVLDAPEGVRIQTLHAFCQGLLKRFPLEAGIAPQMELLTERTQKLLLKEARHRLLTGADAKDAAFRRAMRIVARNASAPVLESLLDDLVGRRRQLGLEADAQVAGRVAEALRHWLEVPPEMDEASLVGTYYAPAPDQLAALARLRSACARTGTPTSVKTAAVLAAWLEGWREGAPKLAKAESYARSWLNPEGEAKGMRFLVPKEVLDAEPAFLPLIEHEQARAAPFLQAAAAFRAAQRSTALLVLFGGLLEHYAALKRQRGMLDYDDLILYSLRLLHQPGMSAWVLFKLDGGLDHLLVDEAQDTSREQWDIVRLLTEEFFAGESANTRPRSLFVVGDEKQSIYRFQGAQPETFDAMRGYFQGASAAAGAAFERVRLMRSFRSAPAVLAAVDATFAQADAKAGLDLSEAVIQHEAHRTQAPGIVELWPLTIAPSRQENDEEDAAAAAFDAAGKPAMPPARPERLHAAMLAHAIAHWLDPRAPKPRQGRDGLSQPMQPRDIMVLVRKRGPLVDALVRQLKKLGVPVAGADRLELNAQLAVKDILAVLDVCLLPQDDLTLAAALRSPIFDLSEEGLFALAQGRDGASLFARLREAAERTTHPFHADAARIYPELVGWMKQVDYRPPFLLLSDMLYARGGLLRLQRRLGPQVIDPVQELLQQALDYAQEECASLRGFLSWMRAGKTEIKRDMEQGQNEVRILTVHGAKGLQAPVVILADALNMQGRAQPLVWHEPAEGPPLPLWAGSGKLSSVLRGVKEQEKNAELRERNRQLYVAMTRAEDELYITGWLPSRKKDDRDSWYGLVREGLQAMPGMQRRRFDHAFPTMPPTILAQLAMADEPLAPMLLRVADPVSTAEQPSAPQSKPLRDTPKAPVPPLWLSRPAPEEPVPPRPLAPSQLDRPVPVSAPVEAQARAMRRGQLVHGLLQWLPEIAPELRTARAHAWLAYRARELEDDQRGHLLAQVLAILAEPAFAAVFAPGSLTEVPISGMVAMQGGGPVVVNAQVDRLRIEPHRVLVIDYKTTARPPARAEQVPAAYLRQMAAYRDLLRRIYPTRGMQCALVFTQGPTLMPLPDALLDAAFEC